MKLKTNGFAHPMTMLVLVVAVAVLGTAMLRVSNADSNNHGSPVAKASRVIDPPNVCSPGYVKVGKKCLKWKEDKFKVPSGSLLKRLKKVASETNGNICGQDGKDIKLVAYSRQSWISKFQNSNYGAAFDETTSENIDPGFGGSQHTAIAYDAEHLANVAFIGAGNPHNPQNKKGTKSPYYCKVFIYKDELKSNWTTRNWESNHFKLDVYMCALLSHEVGHLAGKIHSHDPTDVMYHISISMLNYYNRGYRSHPCYREFGGPYYAYPGS